MAKQNQNKKKQKNKKQNKKKQKKQKTKKNKMTRPNSLPLLHPLGCAIVLFFCFFWFLVFFCFCWFLGFLVYCFFGFLFSCSLLVFLQWLNKTKIKKKTRKLKKQKTKQTKEKQKQHDKTQLSATTPPLGVCNLLVFSF